MPIGLPDYEPVDSELQSTRKKGRDRRVEILRVAALLFSSKGFEATTIREIGDAAGILAGSLYHHFPSKDAILHELLKAFLVRLVPMYEEIVKRQNSVKDTIEQMIASGLKISLESSPELAIIMNERKFLDKNPEFVYVGETMQDIERIWFGVLQEGVRNGSFRADLNLNLVLRMIMDLISATVGWYGPNSRYSVEEVVDTQVKLITHGFIN